MNKLKLSAVVKFMDEIMYLTLLTFSWVWYEFKEIIYAFWELLLLFLEAVDCINEIFQALLDDNLLSAWYLHHTHFNKLD